MRAAGGTAGGGSGVVVVGAGGNIGSHLVPHLARMPGIGSVTLIDHDRYEARNVESQAIEPWEVGEWKADVTARRVRAVRPGARVTPIPARVEALPIGLLRADVILACLDSRKGRQYVNQIAWRLGVPWIDAGVQAEGLMARVDVYGPGPEAACLECGWDERDYAVLEVTYPCGDEVDAAPTGAPSSLGGLAAALQAIECAKLLGGRGGERTAPQAQVVLDAACHRHLHTLGRRNAGCRFDHSVWRIEPFSCDPETTQLADLFSRARSRLGRPTERLSLRLEGQRFVRRLECPACAATWPLWRVASRLDSGDRRCGRCGAELHAGGFALTERLPEPGTGVESADQRLRSFGLAAGDVVSLGTGLAGRDEVHLEIGWGGG